MKLEPSDNWASLNQARWTLTRLTRAAGHEEEVAEVVFRHTGDYDPLHAVYAMVDGIITYQVTGVTDLARVMLDGTVARDPEALLEALMREAGAYWEVEEEMHRLRVPVVAAA
jgi:hypothetical protein